jgi:hypothetical protein
MPRYNPRGRRGWWFVAALADPANPSAAAVAAGTALHPELKSWTGFTSETEDLDNSDESSTFAKTLPGGETPAASSLTIYAGDLDSDPGEVIRAALGQGGANGFVVIVKRSKTPAAGQRCDVYPVRVKSSNDDREAGNAIGTFTVGVSIPDVPRKHVAMVA